MKKFLIVAALALCIRAQADDSFLWTTDGAGFKAITYQRVEPDGIYIEYPLPGGGLGMSKIKFSRLPRAFQRQYGYNKAAAEDYEAQMAQANANVAKELNERAAIRSSATRQRDEENQKAYGERMAEITRLNQAQADAFYRSTKAEPTGDRTIEIWSQFSNGRASTQTSFTPQAADIFNRTTVIRSH